MSEGPRSSLGKGRDCLQPAGVNCSAEVSLSFPPSPRSRKTAFLGSANAVSQFLNKTGGGSTQTARYDASMPALALDIEVPPREESGIQRKAKITFCMGCPSGPPTKLGGGQEGAAEWDSGRRWPRAPAAGPMGAAGEG